MSNLNKILHIVSFIYNNVFLVSSLLLIFCFNILITNSKVNIHNKIKENELLKRQNENQEDTNANAQNQTQSVVDNYPFGKAIFLFNYNGESNQNMYNQLELYTFEKSFASKKYCEKQNGSEQIPSLISNGYKLFFGNSKDYYKTFVLNAKLHPDVMFVLVGENDFNDSNLDASTSSLTNLHAIAWLHWEARLVLI